MEMRKDSQELGQYVNRARVAAGLGLRELARAAGVDPTWIMRLERGEYAEPNPRLLGALARALEVDVTDLYLAAGYREPSGLPGLSPYLRAKYDYLPPEAVDQLTAHFDLINEKYRREQEGGRHGGDHH